MTHWLRTAALICLTILFVERPLHAYVDPGSGSMLLQLLFGGVAGIAVIVKLYWRRLVDRFSRRGASQTAGRSDAQ